MSKNISQYFTIREKSIRPSNFDNTKIVKLEKGILEILNGPEDYFREFGLHLNSKGEAIVKEKYIISEIQEKTAKIIIKRQEKEYYCLQRYMSNGSDEASPHLRSSQGDIY